MSRDSRLLWWGAILSAPLVASADRVTWSISDSGRDTSNATVLLLDAATIMQAASMASLSTHAIGGEAPGAGKMTDINVRVVSPKPVAKVVDAGGIGKIFVDTNSLSRKYIEIHRAIYEIGSARASLLYYDRDGAGYVTMRGFVTICDEAEAKREWWDGWAPFYPEKQNTSYYSVLQLVPDWLEVVGGTLGNVQSGRADWLPVSLQRQNGVWVTVVPAAPSPPPTPPSPTGQWKCTVCQHVYDPVKDGGGLPFEQLADTFKCPVCGSAKSAFKQQTISDGSTHWHQV